MFDPYMRQQIDPVLHWIAGMCVRCGCTPMGLTLAGFVVGLLAMSCIALDYTLVGTLAFLVNRLFDGLDGAVARQRQMTDFGGALDLVCDFSIYAGMVFACLLRDPTQSIPLAFLLFSFVGTITSFLTYSTIAAKRNIQTTLRGKKSFYYLGGICEGTETALMLILLCMLPDYSALIAYTYGGLCWITTAGRVLQTKADFYDDDASADIILEVVPATPTQLVR